MNIDRTRIFAAVGLLGLASLSLVGCSSGSDEAAAETTQQEAQAPEGAARGPMGVSGTIAVVKDGLLQVQDSESQTAVSYTADTAITQQVEGALADISVGVCIMGMGGGESGEALTTVTITQPVDGECTLGFGGGMPGGGRGGEMPEGFEPPADGEMPEVPEGFEPPADGQMPEMTEGGAGGFGGFSSGKVTAVNGSTITIETVSMDGGTGSEDVAVDESTAFLKTEDATSDALVVGACVVAVGEYEGEQYAAASLAVSESGEEGCSAGFGGGFPGRGGNDE